MCCVIYCCPTSYRGRLTLGTHSFPKGQGTLFTGIYIHVYIYIYVYINLGTQLHIYGEFVLYVPTFLDLLHKEISYL